ncbi:MAG TPA: CopG family antitoxin [Bdellovibrio sp.]
MRKEYDFSKAKKAKVFKEVKVIKTIRLDAEILMWLEDEAEKEGVGYQTFLNSFLKKAMNQEKSVEERLRKLEQAVFPTKK